MYTTISYYIIDYTYINYFTSAFASISLFFSISFSRFFKKSIPTEILASVPIPNIDSIPFYHITRYSTETFKQHRKLDVKKLPFFTYLNDINTNFFYVSIVLVYRIV